MRKKISGIERMERNWGILFALPPIMGLLCFSLYPVMASFYYSMTDWMIGGDRNFVGIDNYKTIFTADPTFQKSLFITAYYSFGAVPLSLTSAFILAFLLNQKVKGLAFFRTIFYLPTIVPYIASTILWIWIFNPDFGLLNTMLKSIGLPTSQWIYSETTAIPSLMLMSTWAVGTWMLIFLAGLQSVPAHLYEAVEVDGGSRWQKFWHITIPSMTPTIFFNLVMALISAFQVFNQAYIMTQGGPNNATLFLVFHIYRKAFAESKIGYASALAWILFLIIMILTLIVFKSSNKWVHYEEGGK